MKNKTPRTLMEIAKDAIFFGVLGYPAYALEQTLVKHSTFISELKDENTIYTTLLYPGAFALGMLTTKAYQHIRNR